MNFADLSLAKACLLADTWDVKLPIAIMSKIRFMVLSKSEMRLKARGESALSEFHSWG